MHTTSSFKLQKLTKSMDLRSDSFRKDSLGLSTPRISALNSVAKSVKYNNVTFITGQELCKLRRQPQQPLDNPQFSTAKNNMANIRKRYDQMNQQKMYLENKIQRLTQERQKYLTTQKQLQSNMQEGTHNVTNMEGELQKIKLQLLNREFEKMTIEQMHSAINHDKVVYDKRKFDMEKYIRDIKIKIRSIREEKMHLAEGDDRTLKVYEKFISKLNSQEKERQQHISSMESRIMEKEKINNSSVLRKSQMESIAENAMCERNPEEKQWLKIFWTHKLLEEMLQSKIEREMSKFSTVESAFKNIKIATGVNDVQTMVKKFLSKQEIYGDLLSKITQNEKEIQLLKKEQQSYLKAIKKHEAQLQELETIKSYDQNLRQWMKQTEYYDQKKQKCQFQEMKLKQYLFKQYKQLKNNATTNSLTTSSSQEHKKFIVSNRTDIKSRLIEYLTQLSVVADESIKLQTTSALSIDVSETPSEQFMNRLFRIKPLIRAKITPNSSIKSSNDKNFLQDFIQPYEEEENTTTGDQTEAIEQQRQALLKSNEKFMKEVKNKVEEQKRLVVQTLVKNNREKAVPVPVKKVQAPVQ